MQNSVKDCSLKFSFICRCVVGFISVNLDVTDQLLSDVLHSSNMVDSVTSVLRLQASIRGGYLKCTVESVWEKICLIYFLLRMA